MPIIKPKPEIGMFGEIKLFAGTGCPELAASIAQYLGLPLSGRDVTLFPNDNLFIKLHHSVRGQDVYVSNYFARTQFDELLIMLQRCVWTCWPGDGGGSLFLCARSDKKDMPCSNHRRLVADMIEIAGRPYLTLDPHAGRSELPSREC
jgi:ribose-phosphate pyrophosphokinase